MADSKYRGDFGELLIAELAAGGQFDDESWMQATTVDDGSIDDLFAGICEPRKCPLPDWEGGSMQFEMDEMEVMDEAEGEDGNTSTTNGNECGPTAEEMRIWSSLLVKQRNERVGKDYSGARFQGRCFAVEWRSSRLLDSELFVRQLFQLIGGEAAFILGMEVRGSRADYRVLVRTRELIRWRDWRKKLMFGHGGEAEGEGLYMRVEVPSRGSEESTMSFVSEMMLRCSYYPDTWRYNEPDLRRVHDKGYARPGRRKHTVGE